MPPKILKSANDLVASQAGVIASSQRDDLGLSGSLIRSKARSQEWQRLYRGVYATFTGGVARESELWAALLRAGKDAVFSHATAAELYGLANQRPGTPIHLTVPIDSAPDRTAKIPGVVIHRSRILDASRHPVLSPPRTRIEDTILDLIASAADFEAGYDWICKGIGNRLTTAERIRRALEARSRFPNRREIQQALGDAGEGALSNLERWYLRGVERRHKLPAAIRQAPLKVGDRTIYLDNLYADYLVCVELDGMAAHPAAAQWADKRRDRYNLAVAKIVTMRFGHLDVRTPQAQCRTAAEVANILRSRGPRVGVACQYSGCPL